MGDIVKVERTAAHSHITGLGATIGSSEDDDKTSSGMFGQIEARKAATVIVEMVRNHTITGRAVMLAGPSGTGKTAIAHGLAKTLGDKIPFASISASEVFSLQMNKTESLTQAVRKAVKLRFREQKEILEGEIVKFEVSKKKNLMKGTVTMKTLDMESRFNLGDKMTKLLIKEKVAPGDVICVEKDGSSFERIGKSFVRATDFDAIDPKTKLVHCPEGELSKIKDVTHVLTLHDIDVGNSRTHGFLALYNGETGEISPEKRNAVNEKIQEWIRDGKAELVPGVLFIDEVHLLDMECFSFLNREMENSIAPLFVFATNRGISQIRGSEYYSPHGIPQDLLDRMMIIPTNEYNKEELFKIIEIRTVEEGCEVSVTGMEILTNIAYYKSLRYALNLLPVADVIAQRRKVSMIDGEDLKRAYELFVDDTRSADYMDKMADEFTMEYFDYNDQESELISLDILPLIPSWRSSTDEYSSLLNILGGLTFQQANSDNMDVDAIRSATNEEVNIQSSVEGENSCKDNMYRNVGRSCNEGSSSSMKETDHIEGSVDDEESGVESSSSMMETDDIEGTVDDEESGDESSSSMMETDDTEGSVDDEESGEESSSDTEETDESEGSDDLSGDTLSNDTDETDDNESSEDEKEINDGESSSAEETDGSETSEDEGESKEEESSSETEDSDDSDGEEGLANNPELNVENESLDSDSTEEYTTSDEVSSDEYSSNNIEEGSKDNSISVHSDLGDRVSPNGNETVANTTKSPNTSSEHPT